MRGPDTKMKLNNRWNVGIWLWLIETGMSRIHFTRNWNGEVILRQMGYLAMRRGCGKVRNSHKSGSRCKINGKSQKPQLSQKICFAKMNFYFQRLDLQDAEVLDFQNNLHFEFKETWFNWYSIYFIFRKTAEMVNYLLNR